jgi:hypothetical protein
MMNSLDLHRFRESFPERQTDSPWRVIWLAPDGTQSRRMPSPTWLRRKLHYSGERTGRNDISAHIMDHISLMMIAGRQKKIGMSDLLPEINSTPMTKVPDPGCFVCLP